MIPTWRLHRELEAPPIEFLLGKTPERRRKRAHTCANWLAECCFSIVKEKAIVNGGICENYYCGVYCFNNLHFSLSGLSFTHD